MGNGMAGTIHDLDGAIGPAKDGFDKLEAYSPESVDPIPPHSSFTFPNPGLTFLLFQDPETYQQYFAERNLDSADFDPVDDRHVVGLTSRDTTNKIAEYIVLFAKGVSDPNETPAAISINTYYNIEYATAHELGHALDSSYAGLGSDPNLFSESNIFKEILQDDWDAFNLLTRCGIGGVFNGRTGYDKPEGTKDWICSGAAHNQLPVTANYSSETTNSGILIKATEGNFDTDLETFANLVAIAAGQSTSGTFGLSGYMGGSRFKCSKHLVKTILNTGALPTAASMPSGCRTSGTGWTLP
jgi:hypothetical protein